MTAFLYIIYILGRRGHNWQPGYWWAWDHGRDSQPVFTWTLCLHLCYQQCKRWRSSDRQCEFWNWIKAVTLLSICTMIIFTEPKAWRQKLERQFSIGGRRHGNDLYSLIGSLQCAVWIFLSLLTVTVTLCLALWAEQHCWSIFVKKLEEIVPSFSVLFIHGAFYLQLEKLLNEVRQTTIEGREGSVLPQCALFVCNKWDQVPEEEVKEVQNHVITKLKKCWPGLDHKLQIIFASLKNAIISQNYGVINTEFFSLMSGTSSMVLKSSRARLEMHWK